MSNGNNTIKHCYSGIFSSTDLKQEIGKGEQSQIQILINNRLIDVDHHQITHVGYDVSLGGSRRPFDLTSNKFLNIKVLENSRYIEVKSGHCVSVETEEDIKLGHEVGALVESKVRMVSKGFSHISTTIDPTWSGKLLLTFTNQSGHNLFIPLGTPIATLVFFRFLSPVLGRTDVNNQHNKNTWCEYEKMQIDSDRHRNRRRKILIYGVLALIALLLIIGWYKMPDDWLPIKYYDGLSDNVKSIVNMIVATVLAAPIIAFGATLWKTLRNRWGSRFGWVRSETTSRDLRY